MDKRMIKSIIKEVLSRYLGKEYHRLRPLKNGNRPPINEERQRNNAIMKDTLLILNEERGISDEVIRATKNIISKIPRWIEKSIKGKDDNGYVYYSFKTKERIFDFNINITFVIYDLTTQQYNRFVSDSYYNETKKELYIELVRVNDIIDTNDAYETIQHELHHVYQEYVRNGKPTLNKADETLYKISDNMIMDSNDVAYRIGMIFYLSLKIEQEALGNGLYNILINNLDKEWKQTYMRSDVYKWMNFIKECVSVFDGKKEHIESILSYYNVNKFNYEKLINLSNSIYDNLLRISVRIISLAKERYNLKEGIILY